MATDDRDLTEAAAALDHWEAFQAAATLAAAGEAPFGEGERAALVAELSDGGLDTTERERAWALQSASPEEFERVASQLAFAETVKAAALTAPPDLVASAMDEWQQPRAERVVPFNRPSHFVARLQRVGVAAAAAVVIAAGTVPAVRYIENSTKVPELRGLSIAGPKNADDLIARAKQDEALAERFRREAKEDDARARRLATLNDASARSLAQRAANARHLAEQLDAAAAVARKNAATFRGTP